MHQETISRLVAELEEALTGRFFGKVFQLSSLSLAIDFGLRDNRYLFISIEPAGPRLYLIKRRVRDLEKQSIQHQLFAQALRSKLSSGRFQSVIKDPTERVVKFKLQVTEETGERHERVLVAQLTGRSANLFLVDSEGLITHAFRPPRGVGQQVGDIHQPPPATSGKVAEEEPLERGQYDSLSAAADDHYQRLEETRAFTANVRTAQGRLRKEMAQRNKLRVNLSRDLAAHGDADKHRRLGELLLANIETAERDGSRVRIIDYYADGEPRIELEIDENRSVQEEAASYFGRYTRAKRAAEEIAGRLSEIDRELEQLRAREVQLERIVGQHDEDALEDFLGTKRRDTTKVRKRTKSDKLPGIRRYRSSDDFEVLVGRTARDNDYLTFKVARPQDVWLHCADYPGSHVVIRNPDRKEVPHRTIIEAGQLAAKFSQAASDSKVMIHYTQRKYLAKPKGAAPGLVRMSSFRSLTVAPGENIERI